LLHAVAPRKLKVPGGHIASTGVEEFEPEGHTYPGLQLVHATAPPTPN
jgi:hypothetical protein